MPFGYRGPSIDHSLISPNGHMSKRARAAALKREGERLFAGVELNPATPQPKESETLLAHAARLRELAARGMQVRKYTREADKAEARAKQLQAEGD